MTAVSLAGAAAGFVSLVGWRAAGGATVGARFPTVLEVMALVIAACTAALVAAAAMTEATAMVEAAASGSAAITAAIAALVAASVTAAAIAAAEDCCVAIEDAASADLVKAAGGVIMAHRILPALTLFLRWTVVFVPESTRLLVSDSSGTAVDLALQTGGAFVPLAAAE